MRGYTRWTRRAGGGLLRADWVGARFGVVSDPASGVVIVTMPDGTSHELDADESRMLAVRMIEGAALADGDAIREVQ